MTCPYGKQSEILLSIEIYVRKLSIPLLFDAANQCHNFSDRVIISS